MQSKVATGVFPASQGRIDLQKLKMMIDLKKGGRSLRDVESEAGVSYRTLSSLSTGRVMPKLPTYIALCEWFGVKPDYFVTEVAP